MGITSQKIRVGLMLGGPMVPAWIAQMVDQIQLSSHSEVVLMVVDDSRATKPVQPLLARLRQEPIATFHSAIRRVLETLDRSLLQAPPELPDAFLPVNICDRLPQLPQVLVVPQRTTWSDRLNDDDITRIRQHEVDVLIRIGFRILRGDILRTARYGVWSFHHGDNDINRGGPPGYWEVMQSWPSTGCTLQVLSEDLDNGLVLGKTWSGTILSSVADNNRSTYWKSLAMLPRKLAELYNKGPQRFFDEARAAQAHPRWYSNPLYRPPSNGDLWRLFCRRLVARLRRTIEGRLRFDQWILLVHSSQNMSLSLWRYKRIVPPKDRFWADPFLLAHGGRFYLFFEEYLFATQRGHISVAEILPDGRMLTPQKALVTDHHLSYPFVFEHEGEIYMIPESRGARCISMYRCVDVPARWERLPDLMSDVDAVDATLHRHDGRWWMFVNMIEIRGASSCDELFVFHADSPLSREWTPHPLNPVVSDVRSARPAGKLFTFEGRLYRPSQDCSHRYGWGLNLNWVETLTTQDYREHVVSRAGPDWAADVLATHSFNREGPLHVVDAQIRRSRWR